MPVKADTSRKTIPLTFDGVTGKTFTIRATNLAGGDEGAHSSGPHPLELNENGEGAYVLTYPGDFVGESFVEITGSDGSRADGNIKVS